MNAAVHDCAVKQTPLHALHQELGAKETLFAGYRMPLSYPGGAAQEHRHTRAAAGLFDVSHMGQARILVETDTLEKIAAPFTGDVDRLAPGALLYTLLPNEQGGLHDDVVIARLPGEEPGFHITVNAGGKEANLAHLAAALEGAASLRIEEDKALLALQGPAAAGVVERLFACSLSAMGFMSCGCFTWRGVSCLLSRCGYTGEDGFEISLPTPHADEFARALLACEEVAAVGLAARDSLRLEAGLCLYGQDIDAATTPAEAGLGFCVSKHRRERADFPGSAVILEQLRAGPPRRLMALLPQGKALLRPGAELENASGDNIGAVTSGAFGVSYGAPIALGYVAAAHANKDEEIFTRLRGRRIPVRVSRPPFIPHRYYRGKDTT